MTYRFAALLAALAAITTPLAAQPGQAFTFETVATVETTPVKNQARTGTCWSFATTSFLETEIMRTGHDPLDVSEMYFVRMNYPQKIENFVRMHGSAAMGEGSVAGDVMRAVRLFGIVPEAVYPGIRYGGQRHDHSELYAVLKASADQLVDRAPLSPVWPDAIVGILNAYLGTPPDTFQFQGRTYTPQSFAASLGVDPHNYVELTSFTHHPFNTWFAVEVPDNWAKNESYNIPLDELMAVIDRALSNGFSVDWDGDVSERGFCQADGVAVLPRTSSDQRTDAQRSMLCKTPEPELAVSQAIRQAGFDNHTSTDDHLMQLVGIARDQNGTKYYLTKNSWGITGPYDGYIYMSESYVRAKTISLVVHRDALPADLARRVDRR